MPRVAHLLAITTMVAAIGLAASPAFAQRSIRYSEPQLYAAPTRYTEPTRTFEAQTKVQRVTIPAVYAPGSIVIVNNERKLYYVTGQGEALRYGVAVGKNAELWMGRTFVAGKMVDPKWIPVNGDDPVEGGDPANPLGKRAMYLDWSLLRIHGTPSRGSIGSATSNGCIRMLNEDVIDLFERVHIGAPVYAIKSWKEATRFEETKVAEKIYVDPEAHRQAKEELKELLAQRAEEQKLAARGGYATSSNNSRTAQASSYSRTQQRYPQTWGSPFALGR